MIYEKIKKDRMMSKDADERSIMGVVMNELTVDGKGIDDKDAIKKLTQMRKGCKSNIELYTDTVAKVREQMFIAVINMYLPAEAQTDDIERAIKILDIDSPTAKDMGKVMAFLKRNFDVVDGNLVKEILVG